MAFLTAIAPFHIYYSQEVRPYALSALVGMISTYFLFKKQFFRYFISTAFFLYTIYFAPYLILAHGLWMIFFPQEGF